MDLPKLGPHEEYSMYCEDCFFEGEWEDVKHLEICPDCGGKLGVDINDLDPGGEIERFENDFNNKQMSGE